MVASSVLLAVLTSGFLPGWHQVPPTRTPSRTPTATTPSRTSRIAAFVDDANDNTVKDLQKPTWAETANGLSYRDVVRGTESVEAEAIVSVQYEATIPTTGQRIDEGEISFVLGEEKLELFQEMVEGMSVGGKRRVNLPTSSKYSMGEDPVQFEIELIKVQTGWDALTFRAVRNRAAIVRTALVLSFLPDILGLLGVMPNGQASLFNADRFGAVDILSSGAAAATDPANQWAVQGLQQLF